MTNETIVFEPIGVIHSPHTDLSAIPVQPVFARGIEGTVVVEPARAAGLADLDGFSHVYLFYHFHGSEKTALRVQPYLSEEQRGIFATRAPHRPNKLGMSLVRLAKIDDNVLHVVDIDILDGTPLIDIKPYIRRFDSREKPRSGWQDDVSDDTAAVRGLRDYTQHDP